MRPSPGGSSAPAGPNHIDRGYEKKNCSIEAERTILGVQKERELRKLIVFKDSENRHKIIRRRDWTRK